MIFKVVFIATKALDGNDSWTMFAILSNNSDE